MGAAPASFGPSSASLNPLEGVAFCRNGGFSAATAFVPKLGTLCLKKLVSRQVSRIRVSIVRLLKTVKQKHILSTGPERRVILNLVHTVRSLISGKSFWLTHCHQKCVPKKISRPGFLDVNQYSYTLSTYVEFFCVA